MTMVSERKAYRCYRKSCLAECSIRKYTFFYGSHLHCSQILYLGYLWLTGASHKVAQANTGHSKPIITRFFQHFRNLVAATLEEEDTVIGGEGVEVEIDESKLAKRKYNRGHRINGAWVIGGVEKTELRRVFLVEIQRRDAETLLEIVAKHVQPGSIVLTDLWKGYSQITPVLGMKHKTVNHSKFFKDPITGTCTNRIEATWNALKMKIKPRNRTKSGIDNHLMEFIWRRKNAASLWVSFINALKDIHYELTD
jgi:transposase-like protein